MLRPYLFYCQNDPLKNVELLELLLEKLDADETFATDAVSGVLQYATLIMSALEAVESKQLSDVFASAVVSYIDTGLLDILLKHSTEMGTEDIDELGVQLLYVAAALGALPEVVPYSATELFTHTNGETKGLHPATVALTLGYATISQEPAYQTVIMRILSRHPDHNAVTGYEWVDAFLYSLTIHAGWSYFATSPERDQHYLLQHYFYQAVMNRVPIQDWLRVAFPGGLPPMKINSVLQPLLASSEEVPVTVDLDSSKKFNEVIKEYISAISREAIPTLAQEKFLNQWYGADEEGEVLREWLRTALNAIYRIQTNTLA